MTEDRQVSTVRQGGLFRCCVRLAEESLGEEGQRLVCPNCDSRLVYRADAWEWDSSLLEGDDA